MHDQANHAVALNTADLHDQPTAGLEQPFDQGGPVGAENPDSPAGRKLPRTTLAMALMFTAGVGIIIALSAGTTPQTASASDEAIRQQVETFLAHTKAKEKESADGAALVDRLYNYASRRQVPVDDLRANPFRRGGQAPVAGASGTTPEVVQVANPQRRAELQREVSRLRLQGIMVTGGGATAIIDSQFATVGAQVGSFTITAISPNQVDLTCDEMTYTLHLER